MAHLPIQSEWSAWVSNTQKHVVCLCWKVYLDNMWFCYHRKRKRTQLKCKIKKPYTKWQKQTFTVLTDKTKICRCPLVTTIQETPGLVWRHQNIVPSTHSPYQLPPHVSLTKHHGLAPFERKATFSKASNIIEQKYHRYNAKKHPQIASLIHKNLLILSWYKKQWHE